MGFFSGRDEADIRNAENREIVESRSENMEDWIPNFRDTENMCVYGGDQVRRNTAVLCAISRCYGRMGVVVIHNSNSLVGEIEAFSRYFPELYQHYREIGVDVKRCHIGNNNLDYEPLYGMDANRAVETIYPQMSMDNPSYMQQHLCADILRKYIRILQSNGEEIDLDGILYLCNLDPASLERNEMRNLQEDERRSILAAFLQHENIYLQVRADVNTFASHLEGRIWRRKAPTDEISNISMVEAVKHKAVLTIRVPSNVSVLDYLTAEMRYMVDMGLSFLLVIDSVMVAQSTIRDILMQYSLPISTVLSCDSIAGIFDKDEDMQSSLGKMNSMIIMNTPDMNIANIYSNAFGQYMRQFSTRNKGSHREAFRFFGGYDSSSSVQEQLFNRIIPQEFARLGGGAVLKMSAKGRTVKTERLY